MSAKWHRLDKWTPEEQWSKEWEEKYGEPLDDPEMVHYYCLCFFGDEYDFRMSIDYTNTIFLHRSYDNLKKKFVWYKQTKSEPYDAGRMLCWAHDHEILDSIDTSEVIQHEQSVDPNQPF